MSSDFLEDAKRVWRMAGAFPPDKEIVYPEHGVVQEFDLHHGEDVLEYGCGGGSDAMSWGRRGNRVTATDIVVQNLDITKARWEQAWLRRLIPGGELRTVLLAGSHPLPFPANSFGVVSSHGVVHHIPDADRVVEEFARVLRPGGLCYVMLYTEELAKQHAERTADFVAGGATPGEAFGHCTDGPGAWACWYTEEEGRDLLTGAGLVVEAATAWQGGIFRTFKARKPA